MRLRQSCLIAGGLLIVLVLGRGSLVTLIPFKAGPMPASAAQVSEGQRLLKQLVEGARKEGELNWYAVGWMRGRVTKELAQAFNRRFGLSIKIKGDYSRISPKFSQAIMETKTGLTPTFDVMRGPDIRAVRLWQNGGVEHIDKWELLLKEISPEAYAVREQVSPQDLAGYAFLWGNRIKAINYNTNLISKDKLPKTRVELGNPKFKGTYSLPPWVVTAQYGILVYPKARWLEIVSSWSAWKPPIMNYKGAVDRMLLGEFKFMPSNAYYVFQIKARDSKAPIGLAFFKDMTPSSFLFHVVRKGARHPNAAKLFALWTTSPEANRIFEKVELGGGTPNLALGTGPISLRVKKSIKEGKIKVVNWWDSKESFKSLLWYDSKEGKKYAKKLGKAQTGRK